MKFWPLILGTVLLAGCAHYQSRPLAPEKSAAQLEARRLDDFGLKQFFATNAVPANGATPLFNFPIQPTAAFFLDFGYYGADMDAIAAVISTTTPTLTIAAANCGITAITKSR